MSSLIHRALSVVLVAVAIRTTATSTQNQEDIHNNYRWMKTPWKSPADAPFLKAKKEVFVALQGKEKMALLEKLRLEAKKKPTDTVAQYKWGTAYVFLRRHDFPSLENTYHLGELEKAFRLRIIDESYEYSRLYFLIRAIMVPDKKLRPMAERLLVKNPQDFDVVYQYTDLLDSFKDAKDRQKAITLSQWLIKKRPDWPGGYTILGATYIRSWRATKKMEYCDLAWKSYKAALDQCDPPYDIYKKDILGLMKQIEKVKATSKVD